MQQEQELALILVLISQLNTGTPVPQEFLQKNPVKAKKTSATPSRKHREKKNPQEICQEQFFGSKKKNSWQQELLA